MDYPRYPRDASPEDRRELLRKSMKRELEKLALEVAEEGVGLTERTREEFKLEYVRGCRGAWRDERIAELENNLAAVSKKVALLSQRMKEGEDA